MDPVCVKLELLEMMLLPHLSPPLLVDPKCPVSWLVWTVKTLMLVKKLKPKEEFYNSDIPLNTELLPTGMIWKKSGITLSITNSELPLKNTLFY
jgi:hypothetical protein